MSNVPPPPPESPDQWPAPEAPVPVEGSKKPLWRRKRVLIPAGLVGLIVAVSALSNGSSTSNDVATGATTASEAATATTAQDTSTGVAGAEQAETTTTTSAPAEDSSEADDIVSCTRVDQDNILIEAINNSSKTSTYWLTVAYFDEAGDRVADSTEFLTNLRPGERAAEVLYVFETAGETCEVIDVDRSAAESDPGEMAEISECSITGADFANDVEATVTATNGTPKTSDYVVEVSFVDADGVRVGHGTSFIEAVRTGEAAPGDVFSATDYDPALTCEVVSVTRNANT